MGDNMSLSFRYVDYKKNIINELTNGKSSKELLVFSNYSLKNIYTQNKKNKINLLKEQPTITQYDSFIKELFPTKKTILKENVRLITFFNSIPKEIKEKLNLKNYNESISFGTEFLNFYSEKKKYLIREYQGLQQWQIEKIELLETVKKTYDEYLENNNFIPSDWIYDLENVDLSYLKKFEKLIFTDIIEFTPLEREIIKKIAETHSVEIVIQCNEKEFNEEKFEINTINCPDEQPDISVYKVTEDLEIGVNILNQIELKSKKDGRLHEYKIFTPNIENSKLSKIFPTSFLSNLRDTLDKTEIYSFFDAQCKILSTSEPRLDNSLNLHTVNTCINSIGFKINYNIEESDIKNFYEIIANDFKYFSPEVVGMRDFENFKDLKITNILMMIYDDICQIQEFTTVEEFFKFFKERCQLLKIAGEKHSDIFEKLTLAFSLAKSCEIADLNITFKELFPDNVPLGIYNLIIDDMKNIKLNFLNYSGYEFKGYINPFEEICRYHNSEVCLTDIEDGNLPGNLSGTSFLTEFQKRENGLRTKEQERNESKYRFFKAIFSSSRCEIYFKENGVDSKISPFLKEIIEHYNIEIKNPKLSLGECVTLFGNSLKNGILPNFKEKEWNFGKDIIEDFIQKRKTCMYLAPYSYDNMIKCEFKYYMENMMKISDVKESLENGLSSKFLGNFTHDFLENIARKMEDKILKGDFFIDEILIDEQLKSVIKKNRYKIPLYLDNYMKEILLKNIKYNTIELYKYLREKFKEDKIIKFAPETEKDEKKVFLNESVPVKLNGKVDLLIESQNRKVIIDYKTGKAKEGQLDFYSILLFGNSEAAEKIIFNAFEGKFESDEKERKKRLTCESLKESIQSFLSNKIYTLATKKGDCEYCNFFNICRRES